MDITESGDTISIDSSLLEEIFAFLGMSLQGLGAVVVVVYIVITQTDGILGYVIGLFFLLLGWELVSLFFGATEVFHCLIDKNAGTIDLIKRTPATFWTSSLTSYKLQDLKLINFGKNFDSEKKLSLNFKNRERETFAGSASTKIAETISTSLQIPLQIEFGDERITHVPWMSDASLGLMSTPCLSCGAPLPEIKLNASNIKCVHCGMIMVIQWGEGKFSYRKQTE